MIFVKSGMEKMVFVIISHNICMFWKLDFLKFCNTIKFPLGFIRLLEKFCFIIKIFYIFHYSLIKSAYFFFVKISFKYLYFDNSISFFVIKNREMVSEIQLLYFLLIYIGYNCHKKDIYTDTFFGKKIINYFNKK